MTRSTEHDEILRPFSATMSKRAMAHMEIAPPITDLSRRPR